MNLQCALAAKTGKALYLKEMALISNYPIWFIIQYLLAFVNGSLKSRLTAYFSSVSLNNFQLFLLDKCKRT